MNLAKLGILGSGFGLYGHLPVAFELGINSIYLLDSSKQTLSSRNDLSSYVELVNYKPNFQSLIQSVDYLVISLPPTTQFNLISENIHSLKRCRPRLILEKPLAFSPESSTWLFELLLINEIPFWINYTFLYTPWFSKLLESIHTIDKIDINWTFKAHHFKNNLVNWKASHELGGGPVRFYGIHLFACVARLSKIRNYLWSDLSYYKNLLSAFSLSLYLENNVKVYITIDTNHDKDAFNVMTNDDSVLYASSSPFDSNPDQQCTDIRHPYLKSFYSTVLNDFTNTPHDLYDSILKTWTSIENYIFT